MIYAYPIDTPTSIYSSHMIVEIHDGMIQRQISLNITNVDDIRLMGWGEFDTDNVPDLSKVIQLQHTNNIRVEELIESQPIVNSTKVLKFLLMVNATTSKTSWEYQTFFLEFMWFNGVLQLTNHHVQRTSSAKLYYLTNTGYAQFSHRVGVYVNTTITTPSGNVNEYTIPSIDVKSAKLSDVGMVVKSRNGVSSFLWQSDLQITYYISSSNWYHYLDRQFLIIADKTTVEVYDITSGQQVAKFDDIIDSKIIAYDELTGILIIANHTGIYGYRDNELLSLFNYETEGTNINEFPRHYQWLPESRMLMLQFSRNSLTLNVVP